MAKKTFNLSAGMTVSDAVKLAKDFSIRPVMLPLNWKVVEYMKLGEYTLTLPKAMQVPRAELDKQAIAALLLNENRYSETKFWLNEDISENEDDYIL